MTLKIVDTVNFPIFLNLAQAYEAEFSFITRKMPDENGVFTVDTLPFEPYIGYIFYQDLIPVGFCVITMQSDPQDVLEFYIIPAARRKKLGEKFAKNIFLKHFGPWQVRQIQGAGHAIKFWRYVIQNLTNNRYIEEIVDDPLFGLVIRQRFFSQKDTCLNVL